MTSISEQEKAKQPHHIHNNIKFQVIPVSPSSTETPLQIVCFFDQTKNQTYAGGTELVNDHFNGAIKEMRANDCFRGDLFETLLLTPAEGQIPAKKLLLIGLGDPEKLSLDTITSVGRIAVQEAVKLNVESFSFAPSIKDAGLTTFPAGDVSIALAYGLIKGIDSSIKLKEAKLIPQFNLKEIVLLAGAQHVGASQAGLKTALESKARNA